MGDLVEDLKWNFEMLLIPLSMKFQFCIGIKGNTCMLQVYTHERSHVQKILYLGNKIWCVENTLYMFQPSTAVNAV